MHSLVKAFPFILAASVLANPFAQHEQTASCDLNKKFNSPVDLAMELLCVAVTWGADPQYQKSLSSCAAKSDLAVGVISTVDKEMNGGSEAAPIETSSLDELLARIVKSFRQEGLSQQAFIEIIRSALATNGLSTDLLLPSAFPAIPPASPQGISGVLSEVSECIECDKEKVGGQLASGRNKTKPQPLGSGGNGQSSGGGSRTKPQPFGSSGNGQRSGGGSRTKPQSFGSGGNGQRSGGGTKKPQPFGNSTSGHGGQMGSVRNGFESGRGGGRDASTSEGGNQQVGGSSTSRTGRDRNRQSNGGGRAEGGNQKVGGGIRGGSKNPGTVDPRTGLAGSSGTKTGLGENGSPTGATGISGYPGTKAGGDWKRPGFTGTVHIGKDSSPSSAKSVTGSPRKGMTGSQAGDGISGYPGTKAGGDWKRPGFIGTVHIDEDGSPSSVKSVTGSSRKGMAGSQAGDSGRDGISGYLGTKAGGDRKRPSFTSTVHIDEDGSPSSAKSVTGSSRKGMAGSQAGDSGRDGISGYLGTKAGGDWKRPSFTGTVHIDEDGSPSSAKSVTGSSRKGMAGDSSLGGMSGYVGTKASGDGKRLDLIGTVHIDEDGSPSSAKLVTSQAGDSGQGGKRTGENAGSEGQKGDRVSAGVFVGSSVRGGSGGSSGGTPVYPGAKKGGNEQNPNVKGESDEDCQPSRTVWGAVVDARIRSVTDPANFREDGQVRSCITFGDKNQGEDARLGEDLNAQVDVHAV